MKKLIKVEERKFDLGAGHLGNGITIWNRAREVHGDYEKIAHVGPDRRVTWYIKNPPQDVIDYVERIASGDNPSASASQPWMKVFSESKKLKFQESAFVVGDKTLNDVASLISEYNRKIAMYYKVDVLKALDAFVGQSLVNALYELNVAAVQGRYLDASDMIPEGQPVFARSSASQAQKYKSLQAYMYQISEPPVDKSKEYQVLNEFRKRVADQILMDMAESGYWGD